jgi:hypothetical protein
MNRRLTRWKKWATVALVTSFAVLLILIAWCLLVRAISKASNRWRVGETHEERREQRVRRDLQGHGLRVVHAGHTDSREHATGARDDVTPQCRWLLEHSRELIRIQRGEWARRAVDPKQDERQRVHQRSVFLE